jgi:plasmid stability protein
MSSGRSIQVTLLGEVACQRRKRLILDGRDCGTQASPGDRAQRETMFAARRFQGTLGLLRWQGGGKTPMQTLTLNVPGPLYDRLKHRAQRSNRTVEDETIDLLIALVPKADDLPVELAEAISHLSVLEDGSLWQAAHAHLAPEDASRLEELHRKRQREGLDDAEALELPPLVRQYERFMLVRAQAAALLKQRGHDVSGLLSTP